MNRREALKRTALLLGVAASPAAITQALAQATRPDGHRYLTAGQFATVDAMAETILPATDTPGAREAGVPAFIDIIFGQFSTPEQETALAQGIENFNHACRTSAGAPFAELSTAQQATQLQRLAGNEDEETRAFWRRLRQLTLLGYFSSEVAAKKVLNYDPVPGRWDPDIPVAEVNNVAWFE